MSAPRKFTRPKADPSAFISALTATDQLTTRERQQAGAMAKQQRKDDRYEAWQLGEAAFHDAMAASARALLGRMTKAADKAALNTTHNLAALDLIEAADRLFRLPIISHDDLKDRKVLIRRWRAAVRATSIIQIWDEREANWAAMLAEAVVPGRRESAKGGAV